MNGPQNLSLFEDMPSPASSVDIAGESGANDVQTVGLEAAVTAAPGPPPTHASAAPDPEPPASPCQPAQFAREPSPSHPPSHSVAGRELVALTARELVGDMPKPWRIITVFSAGREVWWTDHGPSAALARERGIPVFVPTHEGHELLVAAEAAALGRAWPDDLQDWCERKLAGDDYEDWLLSRRYALGNAPGLARSHPLTAEERAWFDGELDPGDAGLARPVEPRELSVVGVFAQLGLAVTEAR